MKTKSKIMGDNEKENAGKNWTEEKETKERGKWGGRKKEGEWESEEIRFGEGEREKDY